MMVRPAPASSRRAGRERLRVLGVRVAAGAEHLGHLVVEVRRSADHHERRVLVRGVALQLQREPEHRQALARALRVLETTPPRSSGFFAVRAR